MSSLEQISWLAGIVEGEGSISLDKSRSLPTLNVSMTDKDTIERVCNILSCNLLGPYGRDDRVHWKLIYTAKITGQKAADWLADLYQYLGKRRREQIIDCLTMFADSESSKKDENTCPAGHLLSPNNVWTSTRENGDVRITCKICRNNQIHARKARKWNKPN